jgi:hypothetical protein
MVRLCARQGLRSAAWLRYLPIPALQQVMPGLGHSPAEARRRLRVTGLVEAQCRSGTCVHDFNGASLVESDTGSGSR